MRLPEWKTIESAPKDGTLILVWDGEVFGYPFAARWVSDPILGPPVKKRGRPRVYYPEQPVRPIIGCTNWRWEAAEKPAQGLVDSAGGLFPTHWLDWGDDPTPPTYDAWFRE